MKSSFLLILLAPIYALSQINQSEFDQFIQSEAEKWNIPGASVALVSSDSILYEFTYGYSDVENTIPVHRETCFGLASATKPFTSLLWSILFDKDGLSPSTKVNEIMPDFKMSNEYVTENLKLVDLLSHRTGLSRHNMLRDNLSTTMSDFMQRMEHLPLTGDFRDRLSYSNLNYMILTGLIENYTKKKWQKLLEENIFQPLEMDNTYCNILDIDVSKIDIAIPSIIFDDSIGVEYLDLHYEPLLTGAGNLVSDLDDMEKWAMYQLSGKSADNSQLIHARTKAGMYYPVIPSYTSRNKELGDENYALGWFVTHYKGHKHIHHGGVLYGHTSLVSFLPDDDLAVVVLCNLNGATHFTSIISRYLYDKALKLEQTDWSTQFEERFDAIKAYYAKQKQEGIVDIPDTNDLTEYIGNFAHPAYGKIKVKVIKNELFMVLCAYEVPLKHITESTYHLVHPVNHAEYPIVFNTNEDVFFTADFERGLPPFTFHKTND